jgi:hypothetical protein
MLETNALESKVSSRHNVAVVIKALIREQFFVTKIIGLVTSISNALRIFIYFALFTSFFSSLFLLAWFCCD